MSNRHVLTDADGIFTIGWKRKWEPRSGLCMMARHEQRNLAALIDITRETEIIEITLEPARALTGYVEDIDGKGIADVKVGLSLSAGGNWLNCGTPVNDVATNDQGCYKFAAFAKNWQKGIVP